MTRRTNKTLRLLARELIYSLILGGLCACLGWDLGRRHTLAGECACPQATSLQVEASPAVGSGR